MKGLLHLGKSPLYFSLFVKDKGIKIVALNHPCINKGLFLPSTTKLRRLYFYTCLSFCSQGEGMVSQHALQQVSGWYPSMPCRFPGPSAKGEVEGDLPGSCLLPGVVPAPRGCLLPRRCLLQGVPAPRGRLLKGGVETPPPAEYYCCRWFASYWNAFL